MTIGKLIKELERLRDDLPMGDETEVGFKVKTNYGSATAGTGGMLAVLGKFDYPDNRSVVIRIEEVSDTGVPEW